MGIEQHHNTESGEGSRLAAFEAATASCRGNILALDAMLQLGIPSEAQSALDALQERINHIHASDY